MKYRSKDGDVLDAICTAHYGDAPFQLATVVAANPGLAALGPVLPSGVIITLPPVEDTTPAVPTVRLWD